jgi:YHS domain-containing protein
MILPLCLAIFATVAQEPPKPAENTLCPVMKQKVNEKSKTVVVRGRSYRICCPPCATKLEKEPDKYLNPDGSVIAEKKSKK